MRTRPLALLIALAVIVGLSALWWRDRAAPEAAASTDFIAALSGDDVEGFARATEPGAIQFPRDLGPHPDYQTEWWYYTGNLATAAGREFGFQLTFFRTALTASAERRARSAESASPTNPLALSQTTEPTDQLTSWTTNQVYFAHFTISDIAGEAFYPAEQFARGAAGLAGAAAVPYEVWVNDWRAEETADGRVRLQAATDEVALDLTLTQTLPPVLHGDRGLSQKGAAVGNASYYYSLVQQRAEGTVTVGDQAFAVTGQAWKDHEYSTSALEEGAIGWDWFSLQFDDGTALMLFEIRRADGSLEPWSSGSFIAADGAVTPLALGDWRLTVEETWRSPASDATYPRAWALRVPRLDLAIAGEALLANQELIVSTTYWEGAAAFDGTRAGLPVSARGYVEMTGYAP